MGILYFMQMQLSYLKNMVDKPIDFVDQPSNIKKTFQISKANGLRN